MEIMLQIFLNTMWSWRQKSRGQYLSNWNVSPAFLYFLKQQLKKCNTSLISASSTMKHVNQMDESISLDYNDGLDRLMRGELSAAILQAMTRLKLGWRKVLTFQCFEQMSYAEIADLMGC